MSTSLRLIRFGLNPCRTVISPCVVIHAVIAVYAAEDHHIAACLVIDPADVITGAWPFDLTLMPRAAIPFPCIAKFARFVLTAAVQHQHSALCIEGRSPHRARQHGPTWINLCP